MVSQDDHPGFVSDAGLRLTEFRVEKLFGQFDYKIPLNAQRHVTAVIAPNGTGKTLCLRMIYGLFQREWKVFANTAFKAAVYVFNDKSIIRIEKRITPIEGDDGIQEASFKIKIRPEGGDEVIWTPKLSDTRRHYSINQYLPFLTRVGPSRWQHDATGEIYNTTDLIENFGDRLPASMRNSLYGKRPEALDNLINRIDCRLIETQRLLILREDSEDPGFYNASKRSKSTLAITRHALTLKEIISREINAYASLSQSLDRSFPRRVINQPLTQQAEDLRIQLASLDSKRRELMEAGILDTETDEPVSLPEGQLNPAIAQLLSVYADDARRKLFSLSGILARIKLFKDLIDQRFVTKDVKVSRQNGLDVLFKGEKVSLDLLSSGEQHQLVLFFELLFEINANSLILIDEPELSLHVAWQKKFISDLMRIIELNRFDVVLATHSPQLIGRWNNLVVELGDVYEGEQDVEDSGPISLIDGGEF